MKNKKIIGIVIAIIVVLFLAIIGIVTAVLIVIGMKDNQKDNLDEANQQVEEYLEKEEEIENETFEDEEVENIEEDIVDDAKEPVLIKQIDTYSENGEFLGCIEYYDDGSQISKYNYTYEYKYNNNNLPVEKKQLNENGEVVLYTTYSYNGDGTIRETNTVGGFNSRSVYEYHNDGYSWTTYEGEGEVISEECTVTVDSNGNVIERIQNRYDIYSGECTQWIRQNEYDDNGKRIQATIYKGENNLNSKEIYEYDELGRVILETHYNKDMEVINTLEYTYHEDGSYETCINY